MIVCMFLVYVVVTVLYITCAISRVLVLLLWFSFWTWLARGLPACDPCPSATRPRAIFLGRVAVATSTTCSSFLFAALFAICFGVGCFLLTWSCVLIMPSHAASCHVMSLLSCSLPRFGRSTNAALRAILLTVCDCRGAAAAAAATTTALVAHNQHNPPTMYYTCSV
ncbi:hypothetical protein BO86DRAFT_225063 [Aspergillus japonicus CBS 114.51]|uniref:Uncharacterized protein n=1 Tax=Aspergillus japonicus CBS 114.51 TaxID=1448312 RepID=A0A8T8WNB4_ASPJA|nr:hypothetical protein BO86DRAFT_225063 [Aspergillus japonicus CBS 114.51]RAH77338.1 hypothetical protein BO86DRAFT_225063 [Aspergillus japonicus CBS 114.51]